MSTAVDVVGTEGFSTGVSPRTYTGLTTSAVITDGAIIVAVVTDTHVSGTSATWDGVAMTLLASVNTTGANGRVEIYGLAPIAGHTGNKTFSYAWTSGGSASVAICGVSWSGVDQTGGTVSFPNAATTTGNATVNGNTSVTVNSAVGDSVVAAHATDSQSFFTSNNNTRIFLDNSNFPATASAVANRASGAASVAMTGGFAGTTGTTTFASAGVSIAASVVAAIDYAAFTTPQHSLSQTKQRMTGY